MRGERSDSLVYALDFEPNDLGSSPGRNDFVVVLSTQECKLCNRS